MPSGASDRSESGPGADASVRPDDVVGRLDADRLCPRCLHQLSGTTVYRDLRLGMLHVRCPECGTHSAVTEFPHVGQWFRRFAALVAAVLCLVLFGLFTLDVAGSSASIYEAQWGAIRAFYDPLLAESQRLAPPNQGNYWAASQVVNDAQLLAEIGRDPSTRRTAWRGFWVNSLAGTVAAALSSILWTALLAHRRLVWGWLWIVLLHALASGFALFAWWVDWGDSTQLSLWSLASREYGLRFLVTAIGWFLVLRLVLFTVFRPILRGIAKLLLPAQLQAGLRATWFEPLPRRAG